MVTSDYACDTLVHDWRIANTVHLILMLHKPLVIVHPGHLARWPQTPMLVTGVGAIVGREVLGAEVAILLVEAGDSRPRLLEWRSSAQMRPHAKQNELRWVCKWPFGHVS